LLAHPSWLRKNYLGSLQTCSCKYSGSGR
jgi:hypothetical protein